MEEASVTIKDIKYLGAVEVVENGANLGAFKQLWRKYHKNQMLPSYEDSIQMPLQNIKAPKWNFIDTGTNNLKNLRIGELYGGSI